MKKTFTGALLSFAAGAALTLQAGTSAAETLSFAHWASPAHIINKVVAEPLDKSIQADTNGDLKLRVYPGGELGSGPAEQYIRALQGAADMTWGLPGYTSSQFPKSMVVELPGAIPEGMTGYDMIWNAYDEHLKSEFPGTKPIALWASEPNIFIMKDKQIRKPSDLKGLKIRVSGKAASDLITAYGGTPVQMSATEVYNALQTGLIDGLVTGASAVTDFRFYEVAKSYTVGAPLGNIMFYVVMNQKKYDKLSDEHKAAIDAIAGRKLSKSGEEGWNKAADETLVRLTADSSNTVINLSEEEIAEFEKISKPFLDDQLEKLGAKDVLSTMRGE